MSRFRYCLNASTIATTPILRQIEVTALAGYEAIELWHDHIDTHLGAGGTLAEIRRAIDDSGLTIPTTIYLAGWFQPAGVEHDVAISEVRRRLEQAAAVGAEFSIAGPPPGIADRDLGARHYAELMELGKSYGVKPAFEYLGFVDDINTIDDAIDIIQRSGHPDATAGVQRLRFVNCRLSRLPSHISMTRPLRHQQTLSTIRIEFCLVTVQSICDSTVIN